MEISNLEHPSRDRHISPLSHPTPALAEFKVGVENVIFSVDREHHHLLVLLVKCSSDSAPESWALPGTLVRQGEALATAAYRILAEQMQVENLYLEQLYTFGGDDSHPVQTPDDFGRRDLSVSYFALIRSDAAILMADAACQFHWHSLEALPALACDHQAILNYGHRRLCNKLTYSPVAFEVLPERFTLADLYQFYSTVLGENFTDYSNFRSRLLKLGFLADTGQKICRGAGRPATLYRFDAQAFAPLRDKPLVFV